MSKLDISKFEFGSGDDKREQLVFLSRCAETAERYEDMTKFTKALVELVSGDSKALTVEERNLLSVAYKNVIGALRASWRMLTADEYKDNAQVEVFRKHVEAELEATIKEVLALLEKHLIPGSKGSGDEPEVFYFKMAGDYYRYLAEFKPDDGHAQKSKENYEAAMEVAEKSLKPTHPIRLGLALNHSVCCFEILKDRKTACEMAKKAFDDAISKLDELDEASYKDSTLIMQLLRDNLTLWTEENEDDAE